MIFMIGVLLGAGGRLEANQESGDRAGQGQPRAIEGVWEPVVTIRDCQTGAALFSFLSMDTYIRGGSFLGEGNGSPSVTGYGTWQHAGGRNYTVVFQFFMFNPDGSPAGRLKVRSNIRLSADGAAFRASDTAEISDLNGNVVAQICGTREAKRLQ
jgi:hypothetical protein